MQENQDLIGYDEIIENSMRGVIQATLKKIENSGLPGSHYFVISFLTKHPEAKISKKLQEKYENEMTIVVQHQYKKLEVLDDYFQISLSFSGKYERLTVPYKAVTSFADPSMNFGLKFSVSEEVDENSSHIMLLDEDDHANESDEGGSKEDKKPKGKASTKTKASKKKSKIDISEKVVSLDAFRKEKNDNIKDK